MTIKFTPETLSVLKNFSSINQSILINPGNIISSIATNQSILGVAEVSETFDDTIALHDLPQFLNIMGMFKNPLIDTVQGRQVVIHEGKAKAFYTFAEPSMIAKAPRGLAEIPTVASFTLEAKVLQQVKQAVGIMGLPEIVVRGSKDGVLSIGGANSKDKSASTFMHELGETSARFEAYYLVERFVALPRDYKAYVTQRNVKLESVAEKEGETSIRYWVANQEYSTFAK